MKILKNKKNKIIFWSLLGTVATTSVVAPIVVNNSADNENYKLYGLKSINNKIALNINSLEQLNYVIDPSNSGKIIEYINSNEDIPSNIKLVNLQFKLSSNEYQVNGSNVKIDYDISYDDLNDNSSVITQNVKNIDTGLHIVDLSIDNLRTNIQNIDINNINDLLSNSKIKSTVFSMNVGLNDQNTNNIVVSEAYDHQNNIQKMYIDMNILLNNNYVYNLSDSHDNISTFVNEINIKKIKTKFSNFRINKQNLINAINNIVNVNNLTSLINNSGDLTSFIDNSNFVSNSGVISTASAKIKGLNPQGQLMVEISTQLFNGELIVVEANTNIQSVSINESSFRTNFKNNINSYDKLQSKNSSNIINDMNSLFISNQNNEPSSNRAPLDSISNNSEFLYQNIVIQNYDWLNNYNCKIVLNDGYCFYDLNSNTISSESSINNLTSGIVTNKNLSDDLVDELKNNLHNMTIDNYGEYFDGDNKYPDNLNSGRMTSNKIFNLSNNKLNSTICRSWKFRKSSDNSGPYLKLNLTLEFNEPYTYKGQTSYTFENIPTNTYDPDSQYNWNLFTWSGNDITGIKFYEYTNSVQYTNNIIYLPYKTQNLNLSQTSDHGAIEPGYNGWSNDYRIEKLDATFAKQLVYLKNHRGFFRARIDNYDFSGLPNFIGSEFGGSRGYASTYYFAESRTKTFNFNDCPKLQNLGTRGFFKSCPNTYILWFSFNNCPSLTYLPQDVFNGYASKLGGLHVDLRGSTNITSCDKSAFYAYGWSNQVWVSNESSKNLILKSPDNQADVIVKSL